MSTAPAFCHSRNSSLYGQSASGSRQPKKSKAGARLRPAASCLARSMTKPRKGAMPEPLATMRMGTLAMSRGGWKAWWEGRTETLMRSPGLSSAR